MTKSGRPALAFLSVFALGLCLTLLVSACSSSFGEASNADQEQMRENDDRDKNGGGGY
jgi:hypothetical protein